MNEMWGNEEIWGNLQDFRVNMILPDIYIPLSFGNVWGKVEVLDFFRIHKKIERRRQIITLGGV